MNINRVMNGYTVSNNLRAEGQTSRADYIEELITEILRLRAVLKAIEVNGTDHVFVTKTAHKALCEGFIL